MATMECKSPSRSARLISVEPMIFFIISIHGILINLRTQYLEYRLAKSYNYTLSNIVSADSSCLINGTKDDIQIAIEAETSIWVLYLQDTSFIFPLFTAILLSVASDYIGRKPIFVIASICHLITSSIFLLVSIFDLPLWLLICAQAINGLGGDYAAVKAAALAYIADIYSETSKPFRFIILNMVSHIGYGLSQMLIGQLLQVTHNFHLSFACAVVLSLLNVIYVCCPLFIPESLANTEEIPKDLVKQVYMSYIRLFQTGSDAVAEYRTLLLALLFSNSLYYLVYEAIYAVITIYGIAAPFCWTPFQTGVFAFLIYVFPAICSVASVKVMSVFLNNFWMLHISYISGISQQLVVAFARTSLAILYACPMTGFLRTVAASMYYAELSKLVGHQEQGVLFGCTAIVNALGSLCSPLIFNTSYAMFVKQGHAQYTFLLSAALLCIPMALNGILHFRSSTSESELESEEDLPLVTFRSVRPSDSE